MEEGTGDQTRGRRYGLRSRGNVSVKEPERTMRSVSATGGAPASEALRDKTSRVCNTHQSGTDKPITRKTRAGRKKEKVQENIENEVSGDDNKTCTFNEKGEKELAAPKVEDNQICDKIKEVDDKLMTVCEGKKEQIIKEKDAVESSKKVNVDQYGNVKVAVIDKDLENRPEKERNTDTKEKPSGSRSKDGKEIPEEKKKSFFELPTAEQLLIVRKKLEKIIHKRETNQNKALDLLRILERTKMTDQLLADSKIDLTLEALKFVIKDEIISKKIDDVLNRLKKLKQKKKKEEVPVKDTNWREKGGEDEERIKDKKGSNQTLHWMDKLLEENNKKMDHLNKRLDSLKTGVKSIQPTRDEKGEREEKLEKADNKRSKDFDTEKELIKIIDKLKNEKVEDESVSRCLKELSSLRLTERMWKEYSLEETVSKYCKSSNSRIQKYAAKILQRNEKSQAEIDSITKSIVQLKIEGRDDPKKCIPEVEIREISKTVENISLKEDSDPKLFAKPNKVRTTKSQTVKKEETSRTVDQDSLMARLKKLELENKIHKMKMKLDEFSDNDDKIAIIQLLKDLEKSELTLELLETTRIGLSVNSFRKRVKDQEIAKLGKDIIRKWKSLIPEPKKAKEEEETEEEKEKRDSANMERVRSHCRTLLLSALRDQSTIPDTSSLDTEKLAAGVEEAIFERFKTTNQKYRSQVQSRQYNIRNNITLRENLLVGNISPDEVAVMSHEDMANDDLKKMREDLVRAGFNCLPVSHVEGDKFCTCRICLPPWIQN